MKLVLKATALLCLLLPISLNNAMAQTDAAKAKTILEAVSKKVKALSTLKAGFTLQISNGKAGGSQETKKGTIALKGSKYHLLLGEQEVLCNTKLIWTYNPDSKEVQLSNYNPNDNNSLSPEKLLTNFYDKNYTYTYKGEKKAKTKKYHIIELIPTDNKKQVSKIEISIDQATNMIAGGTITMQNGVKTIYNLLSTQENKPIPDTYFEWDAKAHPGVELVDLR